MGLDVLRPGVDRARDALLGRLVGEQVRAPDGHELVAVAFEQPPVELGLGGEMVVDHGRGDAGAASDLVDRRAAVAAFGEHLGGGALDHLAALMSRKAL
jgi:hypothetical protein